MKNCYKINFKKITDNRGNLTPIEYPKDIPFEINRIYYIYDVLDGVERGFHSHRNLEQILIAINGSIKIKIKTPDKEEIVTLNNPSEGLYIGNMIWREMFDFSPNSVLLVLASKKYDENDYLRNYDEYVSEYRKKFNK